MFGGGERGILDTHIWQICSPISLPMMHERYPNPVSAEIPIKSVLASGEIGQKRNGATQRSQLIPRDWWETRIVKGGRQSVVP